MRDHPTLGILLLDYDYPTALGDASDSRSWGYPVVFRVVPGLTFEMAQAGELTVEVAKQFDEAIRWLTKDMKVTAITGNCGFMMWFEERARAQTHVPCSLSALMQLPAISAQLWKNRDKILIFTANGNSMNRMKDYIHQVTGCREDQGHLVFVGLEDVPHFGEELAKGLKVDVKKAEVGILKKVKKALKEFPETRAILLECAELPPYSGAIRDATELPVYDVITNANFVMTAFMQADFGKRGFYKKWNGRQDSYRFGDNLTQSQRGKLVAHHDDDDDVPADSTEFWGQTGTEYNEHEYLHLNSHDHYGYVEVLGKHFQLLKDDNGNVVQYNGHYAYVGYIHFLSDDKIEVIPNSESTELASPDSEINEAPYYIYVVDDYTHYFEIWSEEIAGKPSTFQHYAYFNPVSGCIYGNSSTTEGPGDVELEGHHHLHYVGRNTYEEVCSDNKHHLYHYDKGEYVCEESLNQEVGHHEHH